MNKPESLRAHLLAAVPELRHNPDRLLVFIDQGRVRCTSAPTLSFEYAYTLQLVFTDYAGHPDAIMLPLLGWLRANQSELLANLEKASQGVEFEADILDNSKVDLALRLPLTERVVVALQPDGRYSVTHAPEPAYDAYEPPTDVELIANGEPLCAWRSVDAGDAIALAMPNPGRRVL
ncbi:phage tail protein [Pseudomonas sp. RIT-PI-AD]|uniref:phage tail protein n=1 Tax=Pseudomonas sp. RIT-PI-AD TaxID=3035294 RepID=UPI0021D99BA2|nr:phage tail protein [Pseudomonas sp. RIT-PI-AD]